jgi:protein BCP1
MEKKPNKKRQRDKDDEMEVEEEEDAFDLENKMDDEIENVEFNFSNILENDYHSLKSLLQPNFMFENINVGALADLLIAQHEDVGTTIRADDQIFGLFSYVPLSSNLAKKSHSSFIDEFYNFLKLKCKNADEANKNKILEIIGDKNANLGLIISERIVNLPEETIPPALGLATKEINECREVEEKDYDKRFDFDYLILISKFVKIIGESNKKNKKVKKDEALNGNNEAYYKFETPLFFKKAVASIEYKIPYKEKNMDVLENSNQPQYVKILFIKAKDYFDIIQKELGCKFE